MLASLRSRLTLAFAVVFIGLGIALWLAATLLLRMQAERETDTLLRAAAEHLLQEWKSPEAALEELREDGRLARVAVTVIGPKGDVRFTSRREVAPWPRPVNGDDGWRVRSERVGEDTLVFGVIWQETETMLSRQSRLLAGLTLVLALLATGLARLVIGRTLRPIGALAAQAEAADGTLALRSPSHDAELRHLVTTLNGLLVRQRESVKAREEFAAAASHELRTPLTVLLGTLEVALSRPREVAEYQETLGHLLVEVQRMTRLTESLLLLSRLESQPEKAREPVNLTEICEEILGSLLSLREERGLTLEVKLAPNVLVEVSPTALAVLVRNLLDNAHRYALSRTTLTIMLTQSPACLTIVNTVEPIGTARSTQNRGAGLGLTLCRRIAEIYGWKLDFQRLDRAFQVTLELPVANLCDSNPALRLAPYNPGSLWGQGNSL